MEASAYAYVEDPGLSPEEVKVLASKPVDVEMESVHVVQLLEADKKVQEMEAAGKNVPGLLKAYAVPIVPLTEGMKVKIFCAAVDAAYKDFRQEQALKERQEALKRRVARLARKAAKAAKAVKDAEEKAKKAAKEKARKEAKEAMGLSADKLDKRALGQFRRELKAAEDAEEAKVIKARRDDVVATVAMVFKVRNALEEMAAGPAKDVVTWSLQNMLEAKWPVYSRVAETKPENVLIAIQCEYQVFRKVMALGN